MTQDPNQELSYYYKNKERLLKKQKEYNKENRETQRQYQRRYWNDKKTGGIKKRLVIDRTRNKKSKKIVLETNDERCKYLWEEYLIEHPEVKEAVENNTFTKK